MINPYHTIIFSSIPPKKTPLMILDWAIKSYPHKKVHIIIINQIDDECLIPDFIKVTRLTTLKSSAFYNFLKINTHNKKISKLKRIGKDLTKNNNLPCLCHLLKEDEISALTLFDANVIQILDKDTDIVKQNNISRVIATSEQCKNDLLQKNFYGDILVMPNTISYLKKQELEISEIIYDKYHIPKYIPIIGVLGNNYHLAFKILKSLLEKQDVYMIMEGNKKDAVDELFSIGVSHRVILIDGAENFNQHLQFVNIIIYTDDSHTHNVLDTNYFFKLLSYEKPIFITSGYFPKKINHPNLFLTNKDDNFIFLIDSINSKLNKKNLNSYSNYDSYKLWTLIFSVQITDTTNNILFITHNLESGGAQRSLCNLAKIIDKRAKISIISLEKSSDSFFYNEYKKNNINVKEFSKNKSSFDQVELLIQKIHNEKIGIVCFWNTEQKVQLLLEKFLSYSNINFIEVSPGPNFFESMNKLTEFQKLISYSKKEAYERLSATVVKYEGEVPNECRDKTTIIPNGVPLSHTIKTSYDINQQAPKIVINGRITPDKFIAEIIEAIKIVQKTFRKIELHIYGDAELYDEIYKENILKKNKEELNTTFFFHGKNFEVTEILNKYDIYVVLSINQGCPNALLEALSVGMPCISNDNGGVKEQIIHNKTGILIKNVSVAILAEEIIKLIKNRDLAKTLGKEGRKHVRENFSMEKMAASYLTLFKKKEVSIIPNKKNSPLSILVVVHYFPIASETFILNQIIGLINRGHDVSIYSSNGVHLEQDVIVNPLIEKYKLMERVIVPVEQKITSFVFSLPTRKDLLTLHKGIKYRDSNMSSIFNMYMRIISLFSFSYSKKITIPFKKNGYDIIHCQYGTLTNEILNYRSLGFLKGKVVTSFQGFDITKHPREMGEGVYLKAFKDGDYFFAVCNAFKQRAIELGCSENKIQVHRTGIDCSNFTFRYKKILKNETLKIVSVCRLVEKKGVEYAIRAIAKITEKNKNVHYTIIGNGELLEKLRELIVSLGMTNFITMAGWKKHDEISKLLNDSHIFVSPNIIAADGDVDGEPNTLVEAMAVGLPVISTFHSSIEDLVKDNINGFLVPQRDSQALSEKIMYVVEHAELLVNIVKEARKTVEKKHDREKLSDDLINNYRRILNNEIYRKF